MRNMLSVCVEIVICCLAFVAFQVYERRYSSGMNDAWGKTAGCTGYHP